MEIKEIKKQFKIFETNPKLVYLDSAASTQTPRVVVQAMDRYYEEYRANVHRGLYPLSEIATDAYEAARKTVADFIEAKPNEIIFTGGATHGLNILAYSLCKNLKPEDNVVITEMEHHANFVPWQVMSKRYGFELRFIPVSKELDYRLDIDKAKQLIDAHTKIVAFAGVSNVLGSVNPFMELISYAKQVGAQTIVDATQVLAHMPMFVKRFGRGGWGADFVAFSGHKMYGPTGIGVLYGKEESLELIDPLLFGGEMIKEVTFKNTTWANLPHRLEAGTPPIAEAIGLSAAIDFINSVGWENIIGNEIKTASYLLDRLRNLKGITIYGPKKLEERIGVVSFSIDGVHPHDAADIMGKRNVAVRAGHHCAMPLMSVLKIPGTLRASIGMYTDTDDVDRLVDAIGVVQKVFSVVK